MMGKGQMKKIGFLDDATEMREMGFRIPADGGRPEPILPPGGVPGAPSSAVDWARAYGGMVSYESAIDALGFETEAEMKASDVRVLLMEIRPSGSISGFWKERRFFFTAAEMAERMERARDPGESPSP
jgi:hypothetical protein